MLDKDPTVVYIGSGPTTGLWCVGCEHYWGVCGGGHSADDTTRTAHTITAPTLLPSLTGLIKALGIVTCTLLGRMSVCK